MEISLSLEEETQFSNAFHIFAGTDPQKMIIELERILHSLKNEIFCLFDKFHKKDLQILMAQISSFFEAKIEEFYQLKGEERAGSLVSRAMLSFHEEWTALTSVKIVYNIWKQETQSIEQCICDSDEKPKQICYKCGKIFHSDCFWVRDQRKQNFYECPFCFISNCLPDRPVSSIVFAGLLPPTLDKASYSLDVELPDFLNLQPGALELRSVRLCAQNRFEMTWPNFCELVVNDDRIAVLKPLPLNSPLKKRVDTPMAINSGFDQCNVSITEYGEQNSFLSSHLVFLCQVRQQKQPEILDKLAKSVISKQQSKQRSEKLLMKMEIESEVIVERIRISNKCQFYGTPIKYPARSIMCRSHLQPFDLESLIFSSLKANSSSRKWKCPICGVRSYETELDLLLFRIFNSHEDLKEVIVAKNEAIEIHVGQQLCSEESEMEFFTPAYCLLD